MVRRVVITGAGSGIGAALAAAFLAQGDEVIGTVRDPERARRLSTHPRLTFRALELTAAASRGALARELDGIDVLINNAGAGIFGAVEEVDDAQAALHLELGCLAPMALTRALLPTLRARQGRVVFMGSLAGRFAIPFQSHYSAAKAALASMSDALRMELRPLGVQVTCVEAADFRTAFTEARLRFGREDSAYAAASVRAWHAARRTEQEAPTPDAMAPSLVRKLTRPTLPARIPFGPNAALMCLLGRALPDAVRERLVRAVYDV